MVHIEERVSKSEVKEEWERMKGMVAEEMEKLVKVKEYREDKNENSRTVTAIKDTMGEFRRTFARLDCD